jgi:hypothetical protein
MASASTSKWADLLKPPAPKVEVSPVMESTSADSTAGAPDAASSAFDVEKFTSYAKFLVSDQASDLAHPSDEEFQKVKDVALNHASQSVEDVKAALVSTQHAFLFHETRYALYLPTAEELDVQQGWEIRSDKKKDVFEGSYVIFSSDFKKVLEVASREKGEKKVRNASSVNAVVVEASKPAQKKSLVERAKAAIADWNVRAARTNKRQISFNDAATALLSDSLESTRELQSVGLLTADDTCILSADLTATITTFKNHVRFATWLERQASPVKKSFSGARGNNHRNNNSNNNKPNNNSHSANNGDRRPRSAKAEGKAAK